MNFDYSEEQQLLADSVRRFLDKEYDFESRKKIISANGWSEEVWAKLAEMGITGLPVSPDYGGFGGGAVDLMSVMEAFGEALVVEPVLPTLIAARLVGRAGSDAQKKAILPAVAEGSLRLAYADSPKANVVGAPVAVIGAAMYLAMQRWLCDPATERGLHWRGLMLKVACWPVFLAGTALAVVHADIPYIPTAKEAVRDRFLRLAWPQLLLIAVYLATLARVVGVRALGTSEGSLELSAEAVWGMMGFATLPVLASFGALYAAWQARRPPSTAPWDDVDVTTIGGSGA